MKKEAFSLLELLISMALFALFMMLLLTVATTFWKKWRKQEKYQKENQDTHALLHQMTQDLRSAVILKDSFFMNLPTTNAHCRRNLFFLTTASSSQEANQLHAVGYFLVEGKNNSKQMSCYRFLASAQKTRDALDHQCLSMLFATASPENKDFCHPLTSSISTWSITPAWFVDDHWMSIASSPLGSYEETPTLLEINISLVSQSSLLPSEKSLCKRIWTTIELRNQTFSKP